MKISIFFALSFVLSVKSAIPSYECSLNGSTCTFSNIELNSTHYEWVPDTDETLRVRIIEFSDAIIPVVTKGICEKFPNLEILHMNHLEVKEIKEDAFSRCIKLKKLVLDYNQIEHLHPSTFQHTKSLEVLRLFNNNIVSLDSGLFSNMPKLKLLHLGVNNLIEFSSELLKNNQEMKELYLYSNELSDVAAEQILDSCPMLKWFWLDDNEILCVRLSDILSTLKSKGISIWTGFTSDYKVRYYAQEKIHGLKCNPDISWMASNYRKQSRWMEQLCNKAEVHEIKTELSEIKERFVKLETEIAKILNLLPNSLS